MMVPGNQNGFEGVGRKNDNSTSLCFLSCCWPELLAFNSAKWLLLWLWRSQELNDQDLLAGNLGMGNWGLNKLFLYY